jgi:hypothetical protein
MTTDPKLYTQVRQEVYERLAANQRPDRLADWVIEQIVAAQVQQREAIATAIKAAIRKPDFPGLVEWVRHSPLSGPGQEALGKLLADERDWWHRNWHRDTGIPCDESVEHCPLARRRGGKQ